jgi:hypothetical protein
VKVPRIFINERPDWRRPIIAKVEECYDDTVEATGRRSVRHILDDNYQFDDLKRLAQGTACAECLEVFPAKPGPDTVGEFRKVYDKPSGPVVLPWQARVIARCCPMCGSEISTEYFEALHEGVLPEIPEIEEMP